MSTLNERRKHKIYITFQDYDINNNDIFLSFLSLSKIHYHDTQFVHPQIVEMEETTVYSNVGNAFYESCLF